ncbi:DUF3168 domain-containing protein [Pseudoduganella sp. RAF19]|uniref:tail completion protein gp17 n=1 Tax=Bacteria TaxID=2 RepID=UPI003F9DFC6F
MALEAKLTAILKGICPRTFPNFADAGTARPYVTYQQIGGDVIVLLGRAVPNVENAEIQINVWSNTCAEAKATIQQIESALILASEFTAKPRAAPASDFDSNIPIYCSRQDFTIWCDKST